MALPHFYHEGTLRQGDIVALGEDTAKHVVNVLRMQPGNTLLLTNGKGTAAQCSITASGKKHCTVTVQQADERALANVPLHLCVAFTKNSSRNEWLLEKATELGVTSITPLIVTRSERENFRHDRWKNILVAAMLQSQQYHLPALHNATTLQQAITLHQEVAQHFIAHCTADENKMLLHNVLKHGKAAVIMIGPEGDFTNDEVKVCLGAHYTPVSLGHNRLRTETAAMAVCAYFNMVNNG